MPEPIAANCRNDDSAQDRSQERIDVRVHSGEDRLCASSATSTTRRLLRSAAALLMLAALLAAVTVGTYVLWRRDPNVVLENHPVEWTQAMLLATAAIVHVLRSRARNDAVLRLSRVGLALFCASLVLRELDLDKFSASPAWEIAEVALRCVMIAAWLIFAWSVIRSAIVIRSRLRGLALSPCALLTLCGGVFYLLSWPLDQYEPDVGILSAMFLEEALQLNGAMLFFAAAWTALDRRRAAPPDQLVKSVPEPR